MGLVCGRCVPSLGAWLVLTALQAFDGMKKEMEEVGL